MQARDCLASDGWCMSGLSCAEIHRDAPISLCLAVILETRAKSRKVADSSLCCNREHEMGHGNVFSQIYACLDPRATNHASRCMMVEESKCATQYRMNARINTTKPNSIMDDPEWRWVGNWDTFRHSEYEMHLVSRARANSYSEHDAICMTSMNVTKIQA